MENKKTLKKSFLSYLLIVLLCCFIPLIFSACSNTTPADVSINQVNEEQKILVDFSNEKDIKKVEITVKHGNEEVSNTVISNEEEIAKKSTEVYAYYGKQNVNVKIETSNGEIKTKNQEIAITASEYNFAPLSGSLPVLMFTLELLQDEGLNNGKEVPTFVWLDRSGAWNWDSLPNNVYPLPTATKTEYTTPNVNKSLMYSKTNNYIKELASINPNSKFNLYLNDFDTDQFMHIIVANKLLERSTCTYLSDGAFSYSNINTTFNVENATEKFEQMVTKYQTTKQQAIAKGYYSWDSGFEVNGNELQKYLLVIAHEEENVNYIFPRLRSNHIMISNDTSNFLENYIVNGTQYGEGLVEESINTMLLNIQGSETKTTELKNLYKFNDDMFAEAENNNKKVMMLLGTYAYSEPDFEAYANLTRLLYGDEYVYYYKGHPNTPTDIYPDKAQQLEELGIIDVESTINAELILFFFPDIYMSGYTSSTFNSLQNEDMACMFWNSTKQQALSVEGQNSEMFDYYVSKLSSNDSTYGSLLTEAGHIYFLIELNDNTQLNYSFAIYDSTTNTIKYYDNEFQELNN